MNVYSDRIVFDDQICNGKPIIKGTRITVYTILEFLASGESHDDILLAFPNLNKEDIMASLQFASNLLKHNFTYKPVA